MGAKSTLTDLDISSWHRFVDMIQIPIEVAYIWKQSMPHCLTKESNTSIYAYHVANQKASFDRNRSPEYGTCTPSD